MAKRWTGVGLAAAYLVWCGLADAPPPPSLPGTARVLTPPADASVMPFGPAPPPPGTVALSEGLPPESAYEPCFHIGFEYLLLWTSEQTVPALVTSGPSR